MDIKQLSVQDEAFILVREERARQDSKWGYDSIFQSLEKRLTVLVEEVGELAEAINDRKPKEVLAEAVQTAACAMNIIERQLTLIEDAK